LPLVDLVRLRPLHHLLLRIILIVLVVYYQDCIVVLLRHLVSGCCCSRVLSLLLWLLAAIIARSYVDDLLAALETDIAIVFHLLFVLVLLVRIHLRCHIIFFFIIHLAAIFILILFLIVLDNVVETWLSLHVLFVLVVVG
jgi:hypothetical protein